MIDTLGSAGDMVWPLERWPAMTLDRPLQIGAAEGVVPSGRIPALAGPKIRRESEA